MILITMLAASLAAAAPAQPPATPQAEAAVANEIAIPFDPPLGQALRYRHSRTDLHDGPQQTRSIDMRLTFTADGEDYRLTVEYEIPPAERGDAGAILMSRPLVLRVSAGGELLGMVDQEAYWAAVEESLQQVVAERSNDPTVRARMEPLLQRLRALPPDEQLAMITENFAPVFSAAGVVLPLDQEISFSERRETALGPLTQNSRGRVERAGADRVRVTTVMTMPAEDLQRAMGGFLRELAPAEIARNLRMTDFEERTVQEASLTTGLLERWEARRILSFENAGVATRVEQIRTIVRLP